MTVSTVLRRSLRRSLQGLGRSGALLLPLLAPLLLPLPAEAQRESYLLGPGSSVGPATKVKPTNCVTAPDGAITCDTELENPPSDTQARPQFELFGN